MIDAAAGLRALTGGRLKPTLAPMVTRGEWLLESVVGVVRRAALACAVPVGWWLARADGDLEAVRAAFPQLSRAAACAVTAEQRSHRASNALVRRERTYLGERWLERSIEVRGREHLARLQEEGRPILIATWHAGVAAALCAGLAQCGLSGAVVRAMPGDEVLSGFQAIETGHDPAQRALGVMTAIEHLKRGETVVFVAGLLQAQPGRQLLPFLGRAMYFASGLAAIARLGNAAIVPALCFIERGRIIVEVSPPVAAAHDDQATMAALGAAFEPRFAAQPGLLWRHEVRHLSLAERVAERGDG